MYRIYHISPFADGMRLFILHANCESINVCVEREGECGKHTKMQHDTKPIEGLSTKSRRTRDRALNVQRSLSGVSLHAVSANEIVYFSTGL